MNIGAYHAEEEIVKIVDTLSRLGFSISPESAKLVLTHSTVFKQNDIEDLSEEEIVAATLNECNARVK